jgi:hypothetical protein
MAGKPMEVDRDRLAEILGIEKEHRHKFTESKQVAGILYCECGEITGRHEHKFTESKSSPGLLFCMCGEQKHLMGYTDLQPIMPEVYEMDNNPSRRSRRNGGSAQRSFQHGLIRGVTRWLFSTGRRRSHRYK